MLMGNMGDNDKIRELVEEYKSTYILPNVRDVVAIERLTAGLESFIVNHFCVLELPEQEGERAYGDIYFYGGQYFIGKRLSPALGNIDTGTGRALLYFLEHVGEMVSEEELKEITRRKSPLNFLVGLKNQIKSHSKSFYLIIRHGKCKRYAALVDLGASPLSELNRY